MFTAVFNVQYDVRSDLTVGKTYEVIDFNEYFGTYLIHDDTGEKANVDWNRFRRDRFGKLPHTNYRAGVAHIFLGETL